MAPTRKSSSCKHHSSISTLHSKTSSQSWDYDDGTGDIHTENQPQDNNNTWENKVLRCLSKVKNYLDPIILGTALKPKPSKRAAVSVKGEAEVSRKQRLEKYILRALKGVEGQAGNQLVSASRPSSIISPSPSPSPKEDKKATTVSTSSDDATKDATGSIGTSLANINSIPPDSIDSTDRFVIRMHKDSKLFDKPRKPVKRLQKSKPKKGKSSPAAIRGAIQSRMRLASVSQKRVNRRSKNEEPTKNQRAKSKQQKSKQGR